MKLFDRILFNDTALAGCPQTLKMGVIGSVIGAGASIAGGIMASNKMKEASKRLDEQMSELKAEKSKSAVHMDSQMYGAPNAADQAAVSNAQQINEEAIQAANNNVVGSTPEAAALAKQGASTQIGSMLQNQAIQRNQRSTQAWNQGQQEQQSWQNYINSTRQQQNEITMAQAQAIQKAADSAGSAASSLPV